MIGVYPERGSALINLAEIEQAYRSGPHNTDEVSSGRSLCVELSLGRMGSYTEGW